jgi:membrane-bound ClpP family serine protease
MALGLVLIAMFGAASASVVLFAYGFPFWMIALAYPLTGFIILLPGVALFGWIKQHRPATDPDQMLTSQSPGAPHPQSPAGSSNP